MQIMDRWKVDTSSGPRASTHHGAVGVGCRHLDPGSVFNRHQPEVGDDLDEQREGHEREDRRDALIAVGLELPLGVVDGAVVRERHGAVDAERKLEDGDGEEEQEPLGRTRSESAQQEPADTLTPR